MSRTTKVLIIATSHASIGDTGQPTGIWFEELSTPYYVFRDAGAEVDITSVDGGKIPFDPHSLN
jgi:putative intracellular protease/amidase